MQQFLSPWHSYTHSWELFSKILLLKNSVHQHNSFLCVVWSNQIQKKYLTLAQSIWLNSLPLQSYFDLHTLDVSEGKVLYFCTLEDLDVEIYKEKTTDNIELKLGEEYHLEGIISLLQNLWYEFHEYGIPWSYVRKWDTLSIIFPNEQRATINFWGNEVESIYINDSQQIQTLYVASLQKIGELTSSKYKPISLKEYLCEENIWCLLDLLEFSPNYQEYIEDMKSSSFDILWNDTLTKHDLAIQNIYCSSLEELKEHISSVHKNIHIFTKHYELISKFLHDNSLSHIHVTPVKSHLCTSFEFGKKDLYICDDILSKIFVKKRIRKKLSADVDLLLKIKTWDYIVHIDHGIGIFQWLIKRSIVNIEKEYLEIHYQKDEKLFVPITEVSRVSKYVGAENPLLTPLSGKVWEKKMKKVHEDIREIAEELLKIFAERKLRSGKKLLPYHDEMHTFQSNFPYSYTEDQHWAIEDIFSDMLSEKNMDRLVVWDVWFGKTEIAFNAAYLSILNKRQVLFLAPLVVLAHEHYHKAIERFRDFGIKIAIISRLQSQKEATQILRDLKSGEIDMLIGTHRVLSEKTQCKRLWLMIVDEEHKFWVVDKEKIKNMKANIDILSLSATPIPRSLNLALAWVRDISLLKTPPLGRKSIQTFVTSFNEKIIQDAWEKEFQRWGQLFFVHNRVNNIEVYKKTLESIFPKRRIIITHWQLPWDELENRILEFKDRKYDILLSTTVIENGIDFSNVNTIFINECQSFGISQIHQLRGRVWRSDAQGYCYLLYKKEHLDGEAAKRIQTIVDYSYLWAWFELAMKDLEIRWGGDILWVRQSWQSKEIWVSLFLKMLEEKIEELQHDTTHIEKKNILPQIELMIPASIPDSFFLTETDKLQFYRELELIEDTWDLKYLQENFFETSPWEAKSSESIKNLFMLLEAQITLSKYKVATIKRLGKNYQITFQHEIKLDELKNFLKHDTEVQFQVVDIQKIRAETKGFANDKKFIEYLLQILQWKFISQKKVRLVKKA